MFRCCSLETSQPRLLPWVGLCSCVSPCCLTWGQTIVMKITVSSFKRSHAHTAGLSAPEPVAGHHWPTSPPETPGHSRACLGQSLMVSLLLSPGFWYTQDFVPSKSLFPLSCVSSGGSMVGSMVTSSTRAYTTPRSAAPRAPAPVAGHCWPLPPQETLKHSSDSVSLCTRFCLSPLCISDGYEGLILNVIFPLLPSFWVFPFALGHGVSVFGGIQHSPVDGCSAAICNFGVLTRENDRKSFYSTILRFWWGNEDNGDLLQKVPCTHYCTSALSTPNPAAGHPIPHTNIYANSHVFVLWKTKRYFPYTQIII